MTKKLLRLSSCVFAMSLLLTGCKGCFDGSPTNEGSLPLQHQVPPSSVSTPPDPDESQNNSSHHNPPPSPKAPYSLVFEAAQKFARGEITAADFTKEFSTIKKDKKALKSLMTLRVEAGDALADYCFPRLLIAGDISEPAVKKIFASIMKNVGKEKSFYKNEILKKARGKAGDLSDDETEIIFADLLNYGFSKADLKLADFSYDDITKGKFLTAYAYTLGDIRAAAIEKQKKFMKVAQAFKTHLSTFEYKNYAKAADVRTALYDRSKSNFASAPKNVVDNKDEASHVLGLARKAKPRAGASAQPNVPPQARTEAQARSQSSTKTKAAPQAQARSQSSTKTKAAPQAQAQTQSSTQAKSTPQPQAQRSNVARTAAMFAAPKNVDADFANIKQQFQQATAQATKVAQGAAAKAKLGLDAIRARALRPWKSLFNGNIFGDEEGNFVSTKIDMNSPEHQIPILTALPTKCHNQFSQQETKIDKKGSAIRDLFKGVVSPVLWELAKPDAMVLLRRLTPDELEFLVSNEYFCSNVLDNLPAALNELSPEQIFAISTVIANGKPVIRENGQLVLTHLIKNLSTTDPLFVEKVHALVPAAHALKKPDIESALRQKLGDAKKNAVINGLEAEWHRIDAEIQRLKFVAKERARLARENMPKEKDYDDAKELIAGLVVINDPQAFRNELATYLPSGADDPVGDALWLLSKNHQYAKELLLVLSDDQLSAIFETTLAKSHERTLHQSIFVENLIRTLDQNHRNFLDVIRKILRIVENINVSPTTNDDGDLMLLTRTLNLIKGPVGSALNRYDKTCPNFDIDGKIYLQNKLAFLNKRLGSWELFAKDRNNQAILDRLRADEPKPLDAPVGNFGLIGRNQELRFEDRQWFSSQTTQDMFTAVEQKQVNFAATEIEKLQQFLAEATRQAPFLLESQQKGLRKIFGELLQHHSVTTPLLDFIFLLQTEHEVATLLDLMPNDINLLSDLVKYLNVGEFVSPTVFKQVQGLSIKFFFYLYPEQLKVLKTDPKFWELLGSQATAAALSLHPWAVEELSQHVIDGQMHGSEDVMARMLSRVDIHDENSAERGYRKLMMAAERCTGTRLNSMKEQIRKKSNVLVRHLKNQTQQRVQGLKDLL